MEKVYLTFEQVRKNIIKSIILVLSMVAVIIGISALIGFYYNDISYGITLGIIISAVIIPVQFLSTKAAILGMTKGVKADGGSDRERRLLSIVENISLSAGLKRVPDVYIVPSDVPNAFASGMGEKSAFIGVTNGLLDMLSDDELSGVIAHEISHIVHKDIMISTLTVSLVSIILILSSILSRLAIFGGGRRRNDRESGGAGIFILILAIISIIIRPLASLIANLISLSISRKREYAADAYAVRLCGYSGGLANALRKIGGIGDYSAQQVQELGGNQMKCMYIHFGKKDISSLFSTHPPIEKRIEIIENMF